MDLYQDPNVDTSQDFDTQEQQLLQQQARIKAMRAAAGVPIPDASVSPGWTSAVTGTHIGGQQLKTPTAALLTPVINEVGADLGEARLNRATSALKQSEQSNYQDLLANIPKAQTVPLGPNDPTGSFVGDPTSAIANIKDPVERARAQQAWQNQQAGNVKTVQPTAADKIAYAAKMTANPLARATAQKQIEDLLIAQPTRESAQTLELLKEQRASHEKELDRQTKIDAANIQANRPLQGSWQDSGQVVNGVKVLTNPATRRMMTADGKFSWSMDNPAGAASTGVDASDAQGGTAPSMQGTAPAPGVPAMAPAPIPLDAQDKKQVVADANRSSVLEDFRSRHKDLTFGGPNSSIGERVGSALLNRVPEVGKSGVAGADVQKTSQFWSDFQDEANTQLRALSGLAVTTGEAARQKATMPGPSSSEKVFNDWIDRQKQLIDLQATRTQAIGTGKFNKWDPAQGAVVDTTTGKVIPGTESPWAASALTRANAPAAAPVRTPAPAPEPARPAVDLTETKAAYARETDPGRKAQLEQTIIRNDPNWRPPKTINFGDLK